MRDVYGDESRTIGWIPCLLSHGVVGSIPAAPTTLAHRKRQQDRLDLK